MNNKHARFRQMNKKKTFISFLLALCMLVSLVPALPSGVFGVKADAAGNGSIVVGITEIDGSTNQSGSYIITKGTFTASYWYVIAASKSGSGFKVNAVYDEGTKSVDVPADGILVAVHNGHSSIAEAKKIKAGYYFTTSAGIKINAGTVASGSYITASTGDLTPASNSNVMVDSNGKIVYGVSLGTTVQILKSNFTQSDASLSFANKSGSAISSGTLGTGYTVTVAGGSKYTIAVKGDINGDAKVTVTDYIMIRRGISGSYTFTAAARKAADINGDGTPDSNDYLTVKTFFKGKSSPMTENQIAQINKQDPVEYVINAVPETKLNYRSVTHWMSQLQGTHSGTVITGNYLTLASGSSSGTFISNEFNVGKFNIMLISWNSTTTSGTVEVSMAYKTSGGSWSNYYSFGLWKGKSGSERSKSDSYGEMDEDTFTPYYTTSGMIKVKIVLNKTNAAPVLRNITIAAGTSPLKSVGAYSSEKYLPVKVRNQRASENGSYGSVMCSATTTAMALSWFGINQTTLTVANGVQNTARDHRYGDWLFNVAYAGEQGLTSYCDFYTIEQMKYSIAQGSPVGCSVAGSLPGSGYGSADGHLILAVGYKTVSGVKYILINDPWTDSTHVANNTPYQVKESDFSPVWLRRSDINGGKIGIAYVFEDLDI